MPRKSKDERLKTIIEEAIKLGLPNRHAEVLAKVSFRKNLDTRIIYLMTHIEGYRDMIKNHIEMSEDPVAFYYKHKSTKYKGHHKFLRYGSLSYMYSYASPIQVIRVLLEDALFCRNQATMMRQLDGVNPQGEEYTSFSFEESRFRRLEQAFRHDLKGNGIPSELVDKVLQALDWDNCPIIPLPYSEKLYKPVIMDSFYVFFSSEEGNQFIEDWRDPAKRNDLIKRFTHKIYNDPLVNPHLIGSPKDIGTDRFEKSCREFGDQEIFKASGSVNKRSEIDAMYNPIG